MNFHDARYSSRSRGFGGEGSVDISVENGARGISPPTPNAISTPPTTHPSPATPRPISRPFFSPRIFMATTRFTDYITAPRTPSCRGVNVSILSSPLANAPENIFGVKLSRDLLVRVTASDLSATRRQHSPERCQELVRECHTASCEVELRFPSV